MNDALLPAGLFLILFAALQVRIVRYVTYPPALLSAVWGVTLLWLLATGQRYLPVSPFTVGIYVAGTIAFAVGGACGWGVAARSPATTHIGIMAPTWFIPMLTFLVVVVAPLYTLKLLAVVGTMSPVDFLYAVRVESLETSVGDTVGAIQNVVPFAMMSAMAAIALPPGSSIGRLCRVILVGAAFSLTILTGSRGAPLTLLLGMGIIASARAKRIPVWRTGGVIAVAVVIFGLMAILLRKGRAGPESSVGENVVAVADGVQDYALGGIVAFEGVVSDPGSVPAVWSPLRTVEEMLNHLGATFEVPSQHAQFSTIGDGMVTNVYTMYFSYFPEMGLVGMLCLISMVGVIAGIVHRLAVDGSVMALLFHGVIAAALLLTIFKEPFYTNANFLLKLALYGAVVTLVVRRRSRSPLRAVELERSRA